MINTVLLVDDHVLFREGIANIISHWDDFRVVGDASNGQEAVEKAREMMPDVILMDISMKGMDGIEAARCISREMPAIRIVILSMSEKEDDLFEAIKSGAQGYVLKDTPSKRLHDQLRGVMRGEAPLSGVVASKILTEFNQPHAASVGSGLVEPLTDREHEVLQLVAEGKSNSQIAETLFLSENTIKKYVHNILTKLQLNNRVEAALYALKEEAR